MQVKYDECANTMPLLFGISVRYFNDSWTHSRLFSSAENRALTALSKRRCLLKTYIAGKFSVGMAPRATVALPNAYTIEI